MKPKILSEITGRTQGIKLRIKPPRKAAHSQPMALLVSGAGELPVTVDVGEEFSGEGAGAASTGFVIVQPSRGPSPFRVTSTPLHVTFVASPLLIWNRKPRVPSAAGSVTHGRLTTTSGDDGL